MFLSGTTDLNSRLRKALKGVNLNRLELGALKFYLKSGKILNCTLKVGLIVPELIFILF
jgi:hypothetical protein